MSLQEITGMEGDVITMQEIFTFRQTGVGADGAVQGHFMASGVRPKFVDRLRSFGVTVSDLLFDPTRQFA
jgi:pilus assembly protein CpaF